MKNRIIYIALLACLFACSKKESELEFVDMAKLANTWTLDSVIYETTSGKMYLEIQSFDQLEMETGGTYFKTDPDFLIQLTPAVGTETNQKVEGMGLWEFPNENSPFNLLFDKGANTYDLYGNFDSYENYKYLGDPENLFKYDMFDDELILTNNKIEKLYNFGFVNTLNILYNRLKNGQRTDYNVGAVWGNYCGYYMGYKHIADSLYTLDDENGILQKDPLLVGQADGVEQFADDYDLNALINEDINFSNGFFSTYNDAYNNGINEALWRFENNETFDFKLEQKFY